jgi:hypothetical protein
MASLMGMHVMHYQDVMHPGVEISCINLQRTMKILEGEWSLCFECLRAGRPSNSLTLENKRHFRF